MRWRLLSPPLCHRLCLLSNVNGVALPCLLPLPSCLPPVLALLFHCPHASNFLAVINLGLLSWLTRLSLSLGPKVAWLIYVPVPFLPSLSSFLLWVFYYANDKIFINVININFGNNSRLRKIMRNDRVDKRQRASSLACPAGQSILIVCEAGGVSTAITRQTAPVPATVPSSV